ncbi:MAG: hypothetical protein ACMUIG_09195 [Thermoplasmatota archaeon]
MVVGKAMVVFIAFCGFIGLGAFLVSAGIDLVDDIGLEWGRGGGCHGNDYGGTDSYRGGYCQDPDGDESGEYCPHSDEYFDEESWEDHEEECPFHED